MLNQNGSESWGTDEKRHGQNRSIQNVDLEKANEDKLERQELKKAENKRRGTLVSWLRIEMMSYITQEGYYKIKALTSD